MKGMLGLLTVLLVVGGVFCRTGIGASRMEAHHITLEGTASGGILRVVELLNRNARYVSLRTEPGESAESVAKRMASTILTTDPFGWWGPKTYHVGDPRLHAEGGRLGPLPGDAGMYVLAGTEGGLEIPRPPLSLSCSYHPDKDQIVLNWVNPPGGYDGIGIITNGGGGARPGTLTSCVFDRNERDISDMDFCVLGFRGDTPSNAAAIHLSNNAQDELFGIPFTSDIAPNWIGWIEGGNTKDVDWEQGTRQELVAKAYKYPYNPVKRPWDKPFYQIIKTRSRDVKAGVWRKFLGLTPGHTYRVSALLNTLEMDSARGDWSFSLHAAYNAPDDTDLTVEQLAGLAQSPDGNKGAAAGQIACYTPGVTTKGKWELCSTDGTSPAPGKTITDIKLPSRIDTLTVWVRHTALESTGVGILWVKLEDVSIMQDKPSK